MACGRLRNSGDYRVCISSAAYQGASCGQIHQPEEGTCASRRLMQSALTGPSSSQKLVALEQSHDSEISCMVFVLRKRCRVMSWEVCNIVCSTEASGYNAPFKCWGLPWGLCS